MFDMLEKCDICLNDNKIFLTSDFLKKTFKINKICDCCRRYIDAISDKYTVLNDILAEKKIKEIQKYINEKKVIKGD